MNTDKIRGILNAVFLVLAVAAVVVRLAVPGNYKLFIYVCGAAIFIKMMEFFIRFTNR